MNYLDNKSLFKDDRISKFKSLLVTALPTLQCQKYKSTSHNVFHCMDAIFEHVECMYCTLSCVIQFFHNSLVQSMKPTHAGNPLRYYAFSIYSTSSPFSHVLRYMPPSIATTSLKLDGSIAERSFAPCTLHNRSCPDCSQKPRYSRN